MTHQHQAHHHLSSSSCWYISRSMPNTSCNITFDGKEGQACSYRRGLSLTIQLIGAYHDRTYYRWYQFQADHLCPSSSSCWYNYGSMSKLERLKRWKETTNLLVLHKGCLSPANSLQPRLDILHMMLHQQAPGWSDKRCKMMMMIMMMIRDNACRSSRSSLQLTGATDDWTCIHTITDG